MSWSTLGLSVGCVCGPSIFFAGLSGAVLLLWVIFVVCVQSFSLLFCLVRSVLPCGRLLGTDLLALLCVVGCCVFIAFPYVVPSQFWYLIVSIPDLCLPLYIVFCPCFIMYCLMSFLVLQSSRCVLLLSYVCSCYVSLPRSVVDWSVVCDCGIS